MIDSQKREVTARDWFACVILGGLVIILGVAIDAGPLVVLGFTLAVVSVCGLIWRLLGNK